MSINIGEDKSWRSEGRHRDKYTREIGIRHFLWSSIRQTSNRSFQADGTSTLRAVGGRLRQQEQYVSCVPSKRCPTLGECIRRLPLPHPCNTCNPWRGSAPRRFSASHGTPYYFVSREYHDQVVIFEICFRCGYMVEVGWLAVEVLLSTTQTSSWTRFFF